VIICQDLIKELIQLRGNLSTCLTEAERLHLRISTCDEELTGTEGERLYWEVALLVAAAFTITERLLRPSWYLLFKTEFPLDR